MTLEATRAFHKMVATCLPLHCRGGRHKTRATRAQANALRPCPTCRGTGRVAHVWEGEVTCPDCGGESYFPQIARTDSLERLARLRQAALRPGAHRLDRIRYCARRLELLAPVKLPGGAA